MLRCVSRDELGGASGDEWCNGVRFSMYIFAVMTASCKYFDHKLTLFLVLVEVCTQLRLYISPNLFARFPHDERHLCAEIACHQSIIIQCSSQTFCRRLTSSMFFVDITVLPRL